MRKMTGGCLSNINLKGNLRKVEIHIKIPGLHQREARNKEVAVGPS